MESADPQQGTGPPGGEAAATAESVVAAIGAQVSYLRIELAPAVDDGWIATVDLLGDSGLLWESIASTREGRGAPDLQVVASLWFQAYVFRASLPVVAPFALDRPGLSSQRADTFVRIARHRPAAIALTSSSVVERTADQAATDLLSGHLAPMIEAITAALTVGQRLLWGNVAVSVATVFRALEGAPGADRAAVREQADAFGEAARPWLAGLGGYDLLVEGDHEGWFWTRTNCCLWDRCEGASRCDDCSLVPADELEGARRSSLVAAGQDVVS